MSLSKTLYPLLSTVSIQEDMSQNGVVVDVHLLSFNRLIFGLLPG